MSLANQIDTILRQSLDTFKKSIPPVHINKSEIDLPEPVKKSKQYIFPAMIVLGVLLVALVIASILSSSSSSTTTSVPLDPQITTPTPTAAYQSVATPLRDMILNFNTTMPDPPQPDYDDQIYLDKLPQ